MKRSIAVLFFLLLYLVTGTNASQSTRMRIISLAPSVTKNLYLLGLEDQIVGVTTYCPRKNKKIEIIGTLLELNIEKIVSMNPTLVIASKEGNPRQPIEKLEKLGINVYLMKQAANFDEICSEFLKLGGITGKQNEALKIIAESRKRIDNLKTKSAGSAHPSVFWQIGTKPIFTVSSTAYVNDFIEFAGGKNIFADIKVRYPQISSEEVIKRNPDIIILTAMGSESNEVLNEWRAFKNLKASATGNIFIVDDDLFGVPTPVALAQGSEIIFNLIHKRSPK